MGMLVVLLALVIVAIMFYVSWNKSQKKSSAPDANKSFVHEAGIDTTNYKTIKDSAKQVIDKAVATREEQDPYK